MATTEDDLQGFELALDTHGRLSLEDSWRLIQEVGRLRCWLRGMVDATQRVEDPCGWCVEMQRWAVEALTGTPCDGAVLREVGDGDD